MIEAATDETTALYKMYGHGGGLLYVGITCDIGSRFTSHRGKKPWWTEVARIDLEQHPTRDAALLAEAEAIRSLKPRWNVVHNQGARCGRPTTNWAWVRMQRDRRVLALVEAGLDGYDIQRGLGTSQANISESLKRLHEIGAIKVVPPRRHPGSARNRRSGPQEDQARTLLRATGLSMMRHSEVLEDKGAPPD